MENDIFFDQVETPIGQIHLVFMEHTLTALTYSYPEGIQQRRNEETEGVINEIEEYFSGKRQCFSTEIHFLAGTPFQKVVWNTLLLVPYGETRTYKWLAGQIGKPAGVRAVGQALRYNPIPIIIPCHRIVCSNRSLGGYSGGLAIKEFLLRLEKK